MSLSHSAHGHDEDDEAEETHGLGIDYSSSLPTITADDDLQHDQHMDDHVSPALSATPSSSAFHTPRSANPSTLRPSNPFNFTTQEYVAARTLATSNPPDAAASKRRGHKYKHSSVHISGMTSIIAPPSPRTPLALPASLPMPTRHETWRSLTPLQHLRAATCLAHFALAITLHFSTSGSLFATALARLLLFDAARASLTVAVDIFANFEVWRRSSLKHPFGLARAHVLAAFALAVFLAFMGLDTLSHAIEHSLENLGSHAPHTSHSHAALTPRRVQLTSLLAIAATLFSALLLRHHPKPKTTSTTSTSLLLRSCTALLTNPSLILTLSAALLLPILPHISTTHGPHAYKLADTLLSALVATFMLLIGLRLGISLAAPLLMSYTPPPKRQNTNVRTVIDAIASEPGVSAVEEARFWQVHYGLCMANVKLRFRGGGVDEMARLRKKLTALVRRELGGKWEVSLQMRLEKD